MTTGVVYLITNERNGKVYVGQSFRYRERVRNHLNAGPRRRPHFRLYRAMAKYGSENFRFDIIVDALETVAQMNAIEEFWIGVYGAREPDVGYNVMGPWRVPNEEIRGKISAAGRGRKCPKSPETRAKMAEAARNAVANGTSPFSNSAIQSELASRVKRTPEHYAKVSAALKGRPKSPEARAAMSAAAKRRIAAGAHPVCDRQRQREISRRPRKARVRP